MQNPAPYGASPTHARFGVLGFLCTLSMITYLDRVCISRVQGNIQHDLGFSDNDMGLVFGAFAVGYCLFEVPGGWMGDMWGSRKVLTRIVIWWSLFTALTGSIDQILGGIGLTTPALVLWGMLLVRFLFGCGEAGAYPNAARVVGSWFPFGERGFAQGAIWFSARLGGAVAPFVIGRLTEVYGWRRAFWILGGFGAAWCVFFLWRFRNTPDEKASCNDAERHLIRGTAAGASQGGLAHPRAPWARLVLNPTTWAMCLASFMVSFGWYFYPTWQPRFLKDVYNVEFKNSEILTGLPFLCGACGALLGGRLSDWLVRATGSRRWGRSLIGLVGFSGAGLCVLFTGFAQNQAQAVTLLCLAFFINDLAIPPIWAVCSDIGGRYSGTLSGIMNTTGAVGAILSPALTPVLLGALPADFSPATRWMVVFACLAGAWFIAALSWLGIDAGRPLVVEEQAES